MDTQNIFTKYQYGFLPNKSTQLASFDLLKHIYSSLNNKKIFGAACLGISKAFDCINHKLLLHKLSACGLSNESIVWFKSYLTQCQVVIFDGKLSKYICTKSGIGQGTILGPILLVYINDIICNTGGVRINMYVEERFHLELQQSLANISVWLTHNALKLNVKKIQMFGYSKSFKKEDNRPVVTSYCSGQALESVDNYNYLGYYLDTDMSLKPLLSHVKKVTTAKIGVLCKIRKYLTIDSTLSINKQMFLPLFAYSGFLLLSCNKSDREDLQIE